MALIVMTIMTIINTRRGTLPAPPWRAWTASPGRRACRPLPTCSPPGMYVCIYIYIHVYVYIYIYIHTMYAYIHGAAARWGGLGPRDWTETR